MSSTFRITGGDFDAAGAATRSLKGELARVGVDAGVLRRVMIAAYEAEMNVVIHAHGGQMWARLDGGKLELEIVDEGPGIPDIPAAMREGFSTAGEKARQMGFGAGMGLPNIRKSSDRFEIESQVGRGTRICSTIYLRGLCTEEPRPAALRISAGRCRSCLTCVKACPTGALRVRAGGPDLLDHLCIDCTACISACPSAVFGVGAGDADRPALPPAEGSVLVVPRGFVCGFAGFSPAAVTAALLSLGFTQVRFTEEWEAPLAAAARQRAAAAPLPVIAPSCPAVVNLVETQFPSLIPHLAPLCTPSEAAVEEHGLQAVSFAAACPAQYAAAARFRRTDRLTMVLPRDLAAAVVPLLPGTAAGAAACRPSAPAGTAAPGVHRVTGIRHVRAVLEQAEAGALSGVPVLECFACDEGCFGSPLFAADPFVAESRWQAGGSAAASGAGGEPAHVSVRPRRAAFAARPGLRLDPDMGAAVAKLARIDALIRALPGRDCAACGAPSCASFAEDVVLARAAETDCPHRADPGEAGRNQP